MTQSRAVLAYLKGGRPITPVKAMAEYGVWRLAAVINRLRNQGHNITTTIQKSVTGKPYAEYRMEA